MKNTRSLNEQIDRILAVSDYKIQETKRSLVEMVIPKKEEIAGENKQSEPNQIENPKV
jgi:hypothetical protein